MSLFWIIVTVLVATIAVISLVDLVRTRARHGTWGIVGWAVLIVVLPLVGSIIYWATRKSSSDEVEAQRLAEASQRQDAARAPFDSTAYRR